MKARPISTSSWAVLERWSPAARSRTERITVALPGPCRANIAAPSIKGGQTYKVKEGDWLSIPPGVPIQSVADAGGLTYLVLADQRGPISVESAAAIIGTRDMGRPCKTLPLFLCLLGLAHGQSRAKDTEWPTYGADLAGTRYRPLDQINASNFSKLEVAWRFRTENIGNRPEYKLEGTPLMVNGVIYTTAGSRRGAIALDAATGELLWVHGEHEGARGGAAPRQLSGRGLAYWTDGKDERILYTTPGYRLICLDAKTGALIRTFGKNGVVDLKLDDDQTIQPDLTTGEIGIQSAPVVAKDTIIIGAAFREGMTPASMRNNKGYVRGFDVRTGKRLWIFHTIPKRGEFGYDTWENGSAEYTGNTGVWTQVTVDEELGLVYLPVETPTSDFYGGHRPGNNLFAESLVCVDLKTGKRKWHYQFVHHPLWDMDISSAPILADISINGRAVKAVAQPTKQGILYVLDRLSGEPVWPFEERTVEKGTVPGEWYSPTQPFPTKPPAYARSGVTAADLIDFTPALHDQALTIVAKYKIGPVFTPPVESKIEGPLGVLTGAANGGTNWPGGSYDPKTHILYVHACNSCLEPIGLITAPKELSDIRYIVGTAGRASADGTRAGGERRSRRTATFQSSRERRGWRYPTVVCRWPATHEAAVRDHHCH